MRASGIPSDGYVFPKVLRACAQFQSLEVGSMVHKDVFTYGSNYNGQVGNSLIDMYAKCRDIESAKQVFNEMEKRDLLSWNSFMSGCVLNDLLREAVELLPRMRLDVEPDIVTWNTVMDAYCRMGCFEEARSIMKEIAEPSIISWTTLISGYLRVGKHKASLEVFRSMTRDVKVHPDLSSLSNILTACRHIEALLNGKETHCYGIKMFSSISFYDNVGAALLALYAKCGHIDEARIVFGFMDKDDVVTWNAMILGYSELSLGHLAMECFTDMQRMGISCDQITLSTLLPSCDLRTGRGIHGFVLKNSALCTVLVCNALMNLYSKCGSIKYACRVFTQMVNKDLISWNTMMGAFARHGLGQGALKLLQDMLVSDVQPNSVTLTSALSACSHSGLIHEGVELFRRMPTFGVSLNMKHFACVVDMLSRAGLLDDAVDFICQMPLNPDKQVWGAVLASCLAYQRLDIACVAAEQLVHLEPHHTGHFVTLANLYTRVGRWEDALRVRTSMEGLELEKPSGCSLLEYGDNRRDGTIAC
ncbi:hypothetical protein MLD38_011651 [Melastoma candidum]|uniref:Uncharacterized protein n=1 Tax=Melastoma candidum TaxID=119954 RepID=A0ACB9R526_9MYRT|nr:hypothetical protein MLD38_011651 [Melastoma candidum]